MKPEVPCASAICFLWQWCFSGFSIVYLPYLVIACPALLFFLKKWNNLWVFVIIAILRRINQFAN